LPGSVAARRQMEKSTAGKFHFAPPFRFTSFDHLVSAAGQGQWEASFAVRD
jgi:hypothetical protein